MGTHKILRHTFIMRTHCTNIQKVDRTDLKRAIAPLIQMSNTDVHYALFDETELQLLSESNLDSWMTQRCAYLKCPKDLITFCKNQGKDMYVIEDVSQLVYKSEVIRCVKQNLDNTEQFDYKMLWDDSKK